MEERAAEIAQQQRVARAARERRAEGRDRLIEAAELGERQPELGARRGGLRIARGAFGEGLRRLFHAAGGGERVAVREDQMRIAGLQRAGACERHDGVRRAAALEHHHAEDMQRARVHPFMNRAALQQGAAQRFSLREPAGLRQLGGLCEPRSIAIGTRATGTWGGAARHRAAFIAQRFIALGSSRSGARNQRSSRDPQLMAAPEQGLHANGRPMGRPLQGAWPAGETLPARDL